MRRKTAFILAAMILSCNMNVLADTTLQDDASNLNGQAYEDTAAAATEENPVFEEEQEPPAQESKEAAEEENWETSLAEDAEMPSKESAAGSGEESTEDLTAESGEGSSDNGTTEGGEGSSDNGATESGEGSSGNGAAESGAATADIPTAEGGETAEDKAESKTDEGLTPKMAETGQEGPEELESESDINYKVVFPIDIKAYLDPGDLSGRGQIFSKDYVVENYGNTDVAIKIKNINIHGWTEEESYEFSEEEITEGESTAKTMNLEMVWVNENEGMEKVLSVLGGASNEYVIFLRAAEYDENGEFVSVSDGGTGQFYFTGTLNPNPNVVWDEDEMSVSFDYKIVNVQDGESFELTRDDDGDEAPKEKELKKNDSETTAMVPKESDLGEEGPEEGTSEAETSEAAAPQEEIPETSAPQVNPGEDVPQETDSGEKESKEEDSGETDSEKEHIEQETG